MHTQALEAIKRSKSQDQGDQAWADAHDTVKAHLQEKRDLASQCRDDPCELMSAACRQLTEEIASLAAEVFKTNRASDLQLPLTSFESSVDNFVLRHDLAFEHGRIVVIDNKGKVLSLRGTDVYTQLDAEQRSVEEQLGNLTAKYEGKVAIDTETDPLGNNQLQEIETASFTDGRKRAQTVLALLTKLRKKKCDAYKAEEAASYEEAGAQVIDAEERGSGSKYDGL